MPVAEVTAMWRYPVKSMGGEALEEAVISPAGIPGDRAFGVVDAASGKVLSAKTVPQLLAVAAVWEEGLVRFIGGGPAGCTSDDADVDGRLSSWLGRPVHLRRPVAGERTPFDLPDDPDHPTSTVEITTPAGTFYDSRSTIHLLSDASLDAARTLHPAGDWDPRRFRPNLLLRSIGARDFPEDGWVGRRLRIGEVEATVRKRSARCAVVAREQPGLARDSEIFRSLVRRREGNLGIYVDPQTAGTVRLGDPVEVA